MSGKTEYQDIIEKVAEELTNGDIDKLTSVIRESVEFGSTSESVSGYQFLIKLEEQNFYSQHNTKPLIDSLKRCGRIDLSRRLEEFEKKMTGLMNVTDPVNYFYESTEFHKVYDALNENSGVILTGIHGSGKTQIALACAQKFKEEAGEHAAVWFFTSISDEKLLHSSIAFAEKLKLKVNPASDKNQTTVAVLSKICDKLDEQKCEHMFIFDDVKEPGLILDILKGRDRFKTIFTSNNSLLQKSNQGLPVLSIKGFTDKEILEFFRPKSVFLADFKKHFTYEEDSVILKLGHELSNLPLGLAASRSYMVISKCSITRYLDLLKNVATSKDVQLMEAGLTEYKRSIISVLQMAAQRLKLELEDDESFRMLEVTAYANGEAVPMFILKKVLSGENLVKDVKLNKFVFLCERQSLGSVSGRDDDRLFSIHHITQLALRLSFDSDKQKKVAKQMIYLLLSFFDKDTRFGNDFKLNTMLLPHVSSALELTETLDLDLMTRLAQIQLYDTLGYTYTQKGYAELSEEPLGKAKARCLGLIGACHEDLQGQVSEDRAVWLYNEFYKLSAKISDQQVVEFLCNRTLTKQDMSVLKERLRHEAPLEKLMLNDDSMSELEYEILVKNKIALPISLIKNNIICEIFSSVLYSHGRTFFYMQEFCNANLEKKKIFCDDLQLAYDLAEVLQKKASVNVVHLVLSQRNGLLYLLLDKFNKTDDQYKKDLSKAEKIYRDLIMDDRDYFQMGLLKKTADDMYHKMICHRQLLRTYGNLLALEKDSAKKDSWYLEAQSHNDKMIALAQNLQTAMLPDIFNMAADFVLLTHTPENREKALDFYQQAFDHHKKTKQFNYAYVNALLGLGKLLLEKGSRDDLELAKKHVTECLELLKTRQPTNKRDQDRAEGLLSRIEQKTPG